MKLCSGKRAYVLDIPEEDKKTNIDRNGVCCILCPVIVFLILKK